MGSFNSLKDSNNSPKSADIFGLKEKKKNKVSRFAKAPDLAVIDEI